MISFVFAILLIAGAVQALPLARVSRQTSVSPADYCHTSMFSNPIVLRLLINHYQPVTWCALEMPSPFASTTSGK